MLDSRGAEMWINNNFHIRDRPFFGRRGVSDLIGFMRKTGIFIVCEIKTHNDKLSSDQKLFLNSVMMAGGIALLAIENKAGNVILKDYAEELKNPEY